VRAQRRKKDKDIQTQMKIETKETSQKKWGILKKEKNRL
jgi:hypothetical protein